jgi:hypothetical protein
VSDDAVNEVRRQAMRQAAQSMIEAFKPLYNPSFQATDELLDELSQLEDAPAIQARVMDLLTANTAPSVEEVMANAMEAMGAALGHFAGDMESDLVESDTPESDPALVWVLKACAYPSQRFDWNMNALSTGLAPAQALSHLAEHWDIQSADELNEVFASLLQGQHRGAYQGMVAIAQAVPAEHARLLQKVFSQEASMDAEEKEFFSDAVTALSEKIFHPPGESSRGVRALASVKEVGNWDFARAVTIARLAADGDLIDLEQCRGALLQVGALVKATYSSFDEANAAYALASIIFDESEYWTSESGIGVVMDYVKDFAPEVTW